LQNILIFSKLKKKLAANHPGIKQKEQIAITKMKLLSLSLISEIQKHLAVQFQNEKEFGIKQAS
jgi:hypothetical protein